MDIIESQIRDIKNKLESMRNTIESIDYYTAEKAYLSQQIAEHEKKLSTLERLLPYLKEA